MIHYINALFLSLCVVQPVNMFPANSLGFRDVYGNVWEWVEDHYNGLPGFKTHYLYEDYSATYCDKKHTILLVGKLLSLVGYGIVTVETVSLAVYAHI